MFHPKTRRMGRERALQFLFGLDMTRKVDWRGLLSDYWGINPAREPVRQYAEQLIAGVCDHQAELDQRIHGALENWTPERVGYIERAVLRIALFEMLYLPDVPPTVAINEAIEVTKRFGGPESPRFVNGVLDRLRKQAADSA